MQLYQQPSVLNAAARWVCDSRKYDHISPRSALAESMVGMVNVNLYRAIPKSQAASSFALPSLSSGLAVTPQPCTYNQGLHWTANRDTRRRFRSSSNKLVLPRTKLQTMSSALRRSSSGTIFCQPLPTHRSSLSSRNTSKTICLISKPITVPCPCRFCLRHVKFGVVVVIILWSALHKDGIRSSNQRTRQCDDTGRRHSQRIID